MKSKISKTALFAAGCFWGVQYYFDQVPGVTKTVVGYTGGTTESPSYEQVCYEKTGHAEAVLIEYDSGKVSYATLVRQFLRMHNPTELNRQGPDLGDQYRSAIFYFDDSQKQKSKEVIKEVQKNTNKPIVTEVTRAGTFYMAEDYHQKYTEKTGRGMCHIPYAPV